LLGDKGLKLRITTDDIMGMEIDEYEEDYGDIISCQPK
jgi:hypothetical protein